MVSYWCGYYVAALFSFIKSIIIKDKKEIIRNLIIESAHTYNRLAGKTFLYVYGEEYLEVSFSIKHFLHLTGVDTNLSAKMFYKNAKHATLSKNQFFFNERHLYANAKKKLPCLKRLPELTTNFVCILKEMKTVTVVYKLSITNLEFTLGLIEKNGTNIYLPKTLRVEDSSVERSNGGEVVDFIFSKDASLTKYDTLLLSDKRKILPTSVRYLIVDELL